MRREQITINSNWNMRISHTIKISEREREREGENVMWVQSVLFFISPIVRHTIQEPIMVVILSAPRQLRGVYMCRDRQPYWHLCTDTLLRFVAVQQAVQYTVRCCFSPVPANPVSKSIRVYLRSPSISRDFQRQFFPLSKRCARLWAAVN